MDFKDEFDFVEKVKAHTRLTETELLRIGYMRLKEGRKTGYITKQLDIDPTTVRRLFNLETSLVKESEKVKKNKESYIKGSRNEEQKKYNQLNKDRLKSSQKEWYKKNKKNILRKLRAKTLLTNEVFNEPKIAQKYIWDCSGEWAREYNSCLECATNLFIHQAKGLCYKCYSTLYRQANPGKKDWRKNYDKEKHYKRSKKKKAKYLKAKELLDSGQVETTPKIENILDHL